MVDKNKNSLDDTKDDTEKDSTQKESFVTMDQLNSFGSSLITTMTNLFRKEIDVHRETISQGQVIPNQELGQDTRGIEPVAAQNLVKEAELEEFMNHLLTVYVHPSANKEDLSIITPNVNGINQPIFRGRESKIKRKYVEVLARNRHTRYDQRWPNPFKKHQYVMAPDIAVSNPFTVRHDPDPRGSEWLQNILNEA